MLSLGKNSAAASVTDVYQESEVLVEVLYYIYIKK